MVSIGKTQPYPNLYLDKDWVIASDEPATLPTFAQYRLRFCVEESFLALPSNGFHLEASKLRDNFALSQLCGVMALTMLFLVLPGRQVVDSDQRRQSVVKWMLTGSEAGVISNLGGTGFALLSLINGRFEFVRFYPVFPTLNLRLRRGDNTRMRSSVNSRFLAASRFLSFVSQAAVKPLA